MKITNLKTEYKSNPVGLKAYKPRLSWEIVDEKRNVFQRAYHVKCAATAADLNDENKLLWNSGRIDSDQSIHVEYDGVILQSGQQAFWTVKVWNNYKEESSWSAPTCWEMGLLNKDDWKAQWIEPTLEEEPSVSTPSPYLRKEFQLNKAIRKATACITCHGLYELSLNGEKVSTDLFTPGWTSYQQRLQYQTYDVTEQITSGANAIGVILGDGWYRGFLVWQGNKNLYGDKLALLFQLKLDYVDGTSEWIISDPDWKSGTGPILKSDIYNGETYDARLEIAGWDCAGFDDSAWRPVILRDYGFDNLVASEGVPVRITETLRPVEKITTPKGELVFDLGQNMVGWVRFRLKGNAGDKITLNHAEVLDQDGNFYTDNLRAAKAEDTYIFKGDGQEEYEPRFTFHGFRYVKVSDYPGEITLDDLEGRVVHSDMPLTGEFVCSDPLINRLQKNIDWGLRGNFLDVPTDCPQRDERLGWTGDAQVFAPTACFNRDAASFYTKWMKDFIVDQKPDGSVPWVVPNVVKDGGGTGWSDGFGSTGWSDAAVIIPWTVYQVYGDTRILEEQYESMKGWVEYMIRESGEACIFNAGFHFGDWLSFAEYYSYNYNAPDYGYAGAHTDKELIATAYFYYTTGLMQKTASLLGKVEDEARYQNLLPKIKDAFNREFVTQTGRLTSGTQTAYTLALCFNLLPDTLVPVVAKRLADDVNYFGHLTTGFIGTPLICRALTDHGYADVAYKLLFNKRYPSWLYPVTQGATTIWERWDGIKPDGTFQTVGMNSFNHYAYGAVGDWLYKSVAGLNPDEQSPGYKSFFIKPWLHEELDFAKASYHSIYGKIVSGWKREGEKLILEVGIPANTKARIFIPCSDAASVTENGKKLTGHPDLTFIGQEAGRVIIEAGSGYYQLVCRSYEFKQQ
ncbi:alpha-L-rhamnosidase [Gaoshiqia sediminis]|uniref:alpha-L-rhamnosidase n=1 Tax=Gaoshiqia sediminis TaxID=2986998 RepID=A0AA41YBR0_9BACT|nr:alpha-L-rhamnosidase [Gaoshiqia sediminis]MCW0481842.1 glycoside hydrolase family 78 protein [Gaoshiqia sediminis]